MSFDEVSSAVAGIERAADLRTAQGHVRAAAQPLGYDRFVLYSADATSDELVEHLFWLEGDWFGDGGDVAMETYLARCPITRHILETDEPYFWTKTKQSGDETYRVDPDPHGPGVHGLQVPVYGPSGLSGAMTFGGERIDASISARLALTIIGAAAVHAARRVSTPVRQRTPNDARLTAREREVIRWIAAGQNQSDTARLLGVSERTVENHLRRIRKRLGARNTAQAILVATRAGDIEG